MIDSDEESRPRYKFQNHLGSGSFGSVFKAYDVRNDKTVAIKRIKKYGTAPSRELNILQQTKNCPNIVKFIDNFYTYNRNSLIQNLVFEYMPTNLSRYIREVYADGEMPIKHIIHIMKQLLRALSHLKSKEIMHRDIKPENILFDPVSREAKLCDFGSAKKQGEGENTPYIVSRYYRAPELLFGCDDYSYEIDIWAAGCVFLELFTGSPVFKGTSDGNQFIQQVYVLGPPTPFEYSTFIDKSNISPKLIAKIKQIPQKESIRDLLGGREKVEEAENLAKLMLRYDPRARPTADECLRHPFFKI